MVSSNAERQARYQQRLRNAAYENNLLKEQVGLLETALNEARRRLGLPEIQLPRSAYDPGDRDMSGPIEGNPQAVLVKVQEIFEKRVRGVTCELQDYEHRIGCGALDQWGNLQDVVFLRPGLTYSQADHFATALATKVHTGGSTAGPVPAPLDEDEERELSEEEAERDRSRSPTTGY